ncbi:autotransporter outer membrane beta-barrel domain-containing protein [Hoeflea marina]|nr:autotransporter outer membrane beta-barrel domain-containing protein [Hoeflea marina]
MRDLLAPGQQSVSVTNDSGYIDSGASDGGFTLGDVSYSRGFDGGITARIAAGGLYTDQDISTGGSFDIKGFYVAPEASIALGESNVHATLGGFFSSGRMTVDRGYLNGGAMDYSNGKTDTETFAAKLRFDWLDAFKYQGTGFTPYASLSYAHSTIDAYTETGGGFPASFNAATDHSTMARLGVDMVHGVTDSFRLLGKAEVSYRFEKQASGTSGEILGLSGFSFAGQDVDQISVRGGAGAEFDVAGGTASLMLNAASQGSDPDVWLRSSWTVRF